ncbi:hypothetical protein [Pseudomonas canadensis]|uniref:hypothetical protein n=1 Tax=Pseudomonas canadensis TaxID=915099 RepID=UPI003BA25215
MRFTCLEVNPLPNIDFGKVAQSLTSDSKRKRLVGLEAIHQVVDGPFNELTLIAQVFGLVTFEECKRSGPDGAAIVHV